MMDINNERKAFEDHIRKTSNKGILKRSDKAEDYENSYMQVHWEGWQARAALVAPQQEPVAWMMGRDGRPMYLAFDPADYSQRDRQNLIPLYAAPPSPDPLTDEQIQETVKLHFGYFNHKPKKGREQEPAILAGNMSHAIALCRAIIAQARGES